MKLKLTGLVSVIIGLTSGIYGLILLGPVVWAWIVSVATATKMIVVENVNAFVAFQSVNPVTVGVLSIFAGAVFITIGGAMMDNSRTARSIRNNDTSRVDDLAGFEPRKGMS